MTTPFETLHPRELADLTTEVVTARLESQGRTLRASETAVIALGRRMCVVCAALGLAPDDWAQFSRLTDDDANPRSRDLLGSWVDVVVAARCRDPGDDLVSGLIAIDVDGAALTTDELRAIVLGLVINQ
jgi:cytochrome P450